jgi:hypothetical protein
MSPVGCVLTADQDVLPKHLFLIRKCHADRRQGGRQSEITEKTLFYFTKDTDYQPFMSYHNSKLETFNQQDDHVWQDGCVWIVSLLDL